MSKSSETLLTSIIIIIMFELNWIHVCFSNSECDDLEAIFNFGDSNSDTGGFWAAFPAQGSPYGMTHFGKPSGRASDGRLVIDFLAQGLGIPFLSPYLKSIGSDYRHGANYATLASTALLPNTSLFVSGISPFSLAIQLNQMRNFHTLVVEAATHHHGTSNPHLPSPNIFGKSLYTLYIGQNDFTSNLAAIGIQGVQLYLPQVISQIVHTLEELYELGGRTFWVLNLAPIGCYSAFLVELPHNTSDIDKFGCLISYNEAVVDYNKMLKELLSQTRQVLVNASLVYVDTHAIILNLIQHPTIYGLTYGTKACCGHGGGAYNFNAQLVCGNTKVIGGTREITTVCSDPEEYVSWDGIHTTDAANKLIASAILNGSYFDPPFSLDQLCHHHIS